LVSFAVNETCAEEGTIVCRGERVSISATLLTNGTYGNPVPNQQIEFFEQTYNTFLGCAQTNPSGIAAIQWIIPTDQPLGISVLNATFRGNQSLALSPSCQWAFITILSHTTISVRVAKDTLAPDDVLTLTATILNDGGMVLPNAYLAVFWNAVRLKTGITDSSGQVSFAINCNSSWGQLGVNQIKVVHERDLCNFTEASEAFFNISIQQLPSNLLLVNPPQNPIELNGSIQSCILLETDGQASSGVPLEVLLDGTLLAYITTNSSGIASLHTDIDSTFSLGPHGLAVRYPGTSRYAPSLLSVEINIVSPSFVKVILPELMIAGTQADIRVEVKDLLGRPLSGASLSLHDLTTGQAIRQPILPDTVLVPIGLQITGKEGPRSFVLNILDSDYLLNRTYTFEGVVWVRPEFKFLYTEIMGYAYPGQEFLVELHLGDFEHDYANTTVNVHTDNTTEFTVLTNLTGVFWIRFVAPKASCLLELLFTYCGSPSEYRLATSMPYTVIVTQKMPVSMTLYDYQMIPPLQQIHVRLVLRALNGSLLAYVAVNFEWLSSRGCVLSGPGGIAEFYLSFPTYAGCFNLSYWIETSRFLFFSAGYTIITLNFLDISSIQGAGILGFMISAGLSILVVSIPVARRRYLLN